MSETVKRTRKVDQWGTVPVYVRLSPAVADRLYDLAEETGGTVKYVVETLIKMAEVVEIPAMVKGLGFKDNAL